MQPGNTTRLRAALAAQAIFLLAFVATTGRGDEPGRLGRFFRFGGNASPPGVTTPPPATASESRPSTIYRDPTLSISAPSPAASTTVQPRLIPQPRVSRAVTEADPLLTRISLGRSDDGNQFGMFLQVYADGTVIDSEGVHQVGRETIKEVLGALEQGDFSRIKGHCGSPSTDFVEQVQMVVYERSLGRLRANAFSFSGNPQGCDHAVRHLQNTLDALQAKLSRPVPGSISSPAVPLPGVIAPPSTGPPIELNGGVGPLSQ